MATAHGVDRQAQFIRLILVILGAVLAIVGWARCATGPVRVPPGSTRGIRNGMRSTIDRAGRVVIPAAIRDRAGLTPGSELEITEDELGVRLQRVAPGPKLVKIGTTPGGAAQRRLVATARPIDIAALIEEERNRWP